MERTDLPKSLPEAREFADLTQERLAEKLNVTRSAISQWETGETVPSGPSRMLLALTFALPSDLVDSWFTKVEAAVA